MMMGSVSQWHITIVLHTTSIVLLRYFAENQDAILEDASKSRYQTSTQNSIKNG